MAPYLDLQSNLLRERIVDPFVADGNLDYFPGRMVRFTS